MTDNFFINAMSENNLITNFFISALYTETQKKSYLYFPSTDNIRAASHAQNLIIEFFESNTAYQKAVESHLSLLFTELMRSCQQAIDTKTSSGELHQTITAILNYINEHKNSATLLSAADKFHYHPKYLSYLIKHYTGKSFTDIINEIKYNEICYYLRESDMSIESIMQITGIEDKSYFYRSFKKHMGVTPGEYRKKFHLYNIQ